MSNYKVNHVLPEKLFPLFGFDHTESETFGIYTTLRKKGDDGKWYKINFYKSYSNSNPPPISDIIYRMVAEVYNHILLGIVDTEGKITFDEEPLHQVHNLQIEEKDRLMAINSFMTIPEYFASKGLALVNKEDGRMYAVEISKN